MVTSIIFSLVQLSVNHQCAKLDPMQTNSLFEKWSPSISSYSARL